MKPKRPIAVPTPPGTGMCWGNANMGARQPHRAGHRYLDGKHDVGLPLEHLHRLAMAYVFELDSVGCKDLVAHPNAILLCQPPGVHPRVTEEQVGDGAPNILPRQPCVPAPKVSVHQHPTW